MIPRWFKPEIDESLPELNDIFPFHDNGGQKETSLNLAINPERVRLDLYQPPDTNRKLSDKLTIAGLYGIKFGKGLIGMRCYTRDSNDQGFFEPAEYPASEASAEKGEKYLEILTDYLAEFVEEFKKIDSLPQDY